LFLEGGVTGMVPMEVAAGMHVAQLREAYPRLQMMGGIDKRSLMQDFRAIDAELERVVPTVLRKGGYIPTVDHGVGPDVPWENYVYFRKQLERMVYSGGAP
jgi:uroporphyrinogen-III decarboxylase